VIGLGMAAWSVGTLNDSGGRYWSAVAFSVIALLSAVIHTSIVVSHRRAAETAPRASEAPPVQRWVRVGTVVCLVAAFAIVPVGLVPVLLVECSGWSRLGSSDKEIVEPGDTVKLWVDGPRPPFSYHRITIANATVVNADELGGPLQLAVGRLNHPEGSDLATRKGGEQSQYHLSVAIPDEPEWVGKTARVCVNLTTEDADKQGSGGKVSDSISLAIPISPPGAGAAFRASWRVAFFGVALPAVLLGFVLGGLAGTPRPKRLRSPAALNSAG
jgi:hypothetical protein